MTRNIHVGRMYVSVCIEAYVRAAAPDSVSTIGINNIGDIVINKRFAGA